MMGSHAPVAQLDLGTVRSPVDDDERLGTRLLVAALVGLVVGAAFLIVIPVIPGLVRTAWCVGDTGPGCDPGSETTGQLVDVVIWAAVLAGTATLVGVPLGWLAAVLARVRVGVSLVLLGPPAVWALVVLGEPFGVALDRMRSPWILAQTTVGYGLVGLLTASGRRPVWRWLAGAALLAGTVVVIALGYPFD